LRFDEIEQALARRIAETAHVRDDSNRHHRSVVGCEISARKNVEALRVRAKLVLVVVEAESFFWCLVFWSVQCVVIEKIFDAARSKSDLVIELAIDFVQIVGACVEPFVGVEEGMHVFCAVFDVGNQRVLARFEARAEVVDETFVGGAIGRFDDHDERRAAADAAELMLERFDRGAVARQKLEQIGAEAEIRIRVRPRCRDGEQRDRENEQRIFSARIDHARDDIPDQAFRS